MKSPAPTLMVLSLADAGRKAWGGEESGEKSFEAVLVQY